MDALKKEILKTCLHHFLQQGVRKMSNDRLVALLGISTKTLYKHFRDKEDLLRQALEMHYAQQYELFENLAREERVPVLLFYVWKKGFDLEFDVNKHFYQDLLHYYPQLASEIDNRNREQVWVALRDLVFRGIEEGDLQQNIVPEAVLESMSVLYVSVVRKGEFNKLRLPPDVILQNTLVAYIRGICTGTGLQALDKHLSTYRVAQQQKSNPQLSS